ncbi:3'-5' exonuclease [Aestuariicoccus sp. MJ-SS9]|uniref:3'-5' exonuclease n=1 Tax=Aestuariicoccus sp. MJ-SS9 TaxID=3079855 RepID=UPI00290FBED1|nr:3'-5' exonuclease [Aestuariicoccus sp. MJ-SS9]MDU8913227.1 3'-5' exonuclease [Aestuariicoccus sp. MJ-SS9]
MSGLSLRLRVFLFFALLALGASALVLGALWFGHARSAVTSVADGFVTAAILSTLGIVGLSAGIWLLFDENVAKPIDRLAAAMRAGAHAGVDPALDTQSARYLGDLAPAADAVTRKAADAAMATAQRVATETARLREEQARLTALLTEIPVATILANPQGQIVLYDGQAAEVLAQQGVPRLNAPLTDYFAPAALTQARRKMERSGHEVAFQALGAEADTAYDARLKPLDAGSFLMIIDTAEARIAADAARPLVYDFALLDRAAPADVRDTPLDQLCFCVFDTETTGLLPHKDAIVQIGALRVVNGRIVPGEEIDQLVDPRRPIPPASTKVHGVSDAMVVGKPGIEEAGRKLHRFARDAVIVAHNAPFDMAFLRRDAEAMGVAWDHPILDTVLLSAVAFGAHETHTLDALCDRLRIEIPERLRHTALGDARATAEALVHLIPILQGRGLTTFGQLLEETRKHGRLLEDLN